MKVDRKNDLLRIWKLTAPLTEWPFVPEFRFDPERRWRFDWACERLRLAVEVEGVTYFGKAVGRHQAAKGIENDMEKYNRAIELGWRVLRYSQRMLAEKPFDVVVQIMEVAELCNQSRPT